jgi:phosphoribosylformylglycinamidine cyclo-ligase
MNLDDLACVGAIDNIIISSTIGRNKNRIPAEVLEALISGTSEFIETLAKQGVKIHHSGGETADVGDIVRTVDVGFTAFARLERHKLIVNKIQPGDVIVGLASYGKATYESTYNSGIGSNGLTSARHDVFHKYLAQKYPEGFDPAVPDELVYSGKYKLTDQFSATNMTVGKMVLSPTRTYLPVFKKILSELSNKINGIIHCTGGGQTKVLHFINNLHIIKDNLLPIPPVFKLIQESSSTDWKEMYQVFNMGHRMEFYLPEEHAQQIIDISTEFGIDAQIVGCCEKSNEPKVTVKSEAGSFEYTN